MTTPNTNQPNESDLKAAEEIREKRPADPTYFYLHNQDAEIIAKYHQAEREEVVGVLENALKAVDHTKKHFQSPIPITKEQQEEVGEDFTILWGELEEALTQLTNLKDKLTTK